MRRQSLRYGAAGGLGLILVAGLVFMVNWSIPKDSITNCVVAKAPAPM